MKRVLPLKREDDLVCLARNIVYKQKPYWCNASCRQLSLSLLKPRNYFDYDPVKTYPLIVFICGGGFEKEDNTVWVPELAYFAKHGYVVACVDYSVLPYTQWPEQIQEIKEAIRFLRANAEQFGIIPDRVAVMGESAGGYLSSLAGVSGETREYDTGSNLDQSSAVQAAVPWYPVVNMLAHDFSKLHLDLHEFVDCTELITPDTPPFFIVHGTGDEQVPHTESEYLYQKLQEAGVESELVLVEGAGHADAAIIQDEIKEMMLEFLDEHLKQK